MLYNVMTVNDAVGPHTETFYKLQLWSLYLHGRRSSRSGSVHPQSLFLHLLRYVSHVWAGDVKMFKNNPTSVFLFSSSLSRIFNFSQLIIGVFFFFKNLTSTLLCFQSSICVWWRCTSVLISTAVNTSCPVLHFIPVFTVLAIDYLLSCDWSRTLSQLRLLMEPEMWTFIFYSKATWIDKVSVVHPSSVTTPLPFMHRLSISLCFVASR